MGAELTFEIEGDGISERRELRRGEGCSRCAGALRDDARRRSLWLLEQRRRWLNGDELLDERLAMIVLEKGELARKGDGEEGVDV